MVCPGESSAGAGTCTLGEDVSEHPVYLALFGYQLPWDILCVMLSRIGLRVCMVVLGLSFRAGYCFGGPS